MPENLLTIDQVAGRLKVVGRTVERHLTKLKAAGLQEVRVLGKPRFRESSLDKMIKQAAERENPLI